MLLLPLIGMSVMLLAGGAAFYLQRMRPTSEPVAARPQTKTPAAPAPVASSAAPAPALAPKVLPAPVPMLAAAPADAPTPSDAWIVQVAAFSRSDRAALLVDRLAQTGLPAYQMAGNAGEQGLLHFVRVGPYRAAEQANAARATLLQSPEFEGAFVRNTAASAAER
jgi:cell division septation protein DedD